MAEGVRIGDVSHFFNKISVAVFTTRAPIKLGDKLHFLGAHTDFLQEIRSLQIEHENVSDAVAGSEVALKVDQRVRLGDSVFLLRD
jgi:putative protease